MFKDFRALFRKKDVKKPDEPHLKTTDRVFSPREDRQIDTAIIAIANQKGGCGKTTTAINLSAALADKGYKILLIDLDAQAHASLGLGVDLDRLTYSIYEVMVKGLGLEDAIVPTATDNVDVVAATHMLTGAQLEISDLLGRESILHTAIYRMLATSKKRYDYIILDCSPSLNLLTINGLTSAKSLLIPIQTHYFSLEGMKELFSTIKIVKERLNPQLEILGILPTLFDKRTRMNKEILSQIKDYFKDKLFKTQIRMNVKLAEAQVYRKSILAYDRTSNGAQDYLALADEIISLINPEIIEEEKENNWITDIEQKVAQN